MINLLIDCRSIHPNKSGGIENYVYSIVNELSKNDILLTIDLRYTNIKLFNKNLNTKKITYIYDPIVAIWEILKKKFYILYRVLDYFNRKIFKVNLIHRRKNWAINLKYDLVFYPFHLDEYQHRIRHIVTIHAYLPEYNEKDHYIISEHVKKASKVITSWPFPFNDLCTRFPFHRSKIVMIPFTTENIIRCEPDGTNLEYLSKRNYILYPSFFVERKNHQFIINAYNIAKSSNIDLPIMVFTGGGNEIVIDKCVDLISKYNLNDYFVFLNHVSDSKLNYLYQNCYATISASTCEAGIGPLHEGSFFGKHCFLADTKQGRMHAELLNVNCTFFDLSDPNTLCSMINQYLKTNPLPSCNNDTIEKMRPFTQRVFIEKFLEQISTI